ncbi:cell division site-positioning protein MapZ family protein [Enterococcus devriesei]|uniref:cell division site-positioning protein MapZ family protein n=1 Tax=Enterococcus devriesei TaxID=319970 RepID=UPI00288FA232|nr:cell division site-positioning protein MapZ family protein [Enterococcus devriesei]MDT2820179.1 cell division site-positioning protein MapZ family protein [Enterococcus devriesei]
MQKCPNCGFEPVEGYATCPKCGFSLQLNDQKEIEDRNDTIEWSELADMPIESVQKMFKENEEKMKEEENKKNSTEEMPEMNPILARYIREHKEGAIEEEPEESPLETENKTDEPKSESTPIDETPTESAEQTVEADEAESTEPKIEEAALEMPDAELEPENQETVPAVEAKAVEATPKEEFKEEPSDENEESKEEPAENLSEPVEATTDSDLNSNEPEAVEEAAIAPEPAVATESATKASKPTGEEPKKNRKKLYITLAAVAVLGIGGGYYYHHEKEVEAQRIATVKKENKAIDTIEQDLASFYTDGQQTFLAADKVNENTDQLADEIAQYKGHKRYDKVKKEYDGLVAKQKAQQSVDQLFTSAAINGDKLADKPLLKAAEPVDLTINTGDTQFNTLMNQAIANAKDQYAKIETAKQKADVLLKDGNVIDSVNRDQYNAANDAVKAVANQALVQTQKDELAKVDQTLKDKEKKAADEKAAAEKAAQEKAEQEKAAQNQSTSSSQAGDTSSDAYAWAPGVKEKVIQTCISRGYIVEGGYRLEPVKVENGEGYYNLYATSNRASLTKGYTDADLPMYLVTINCKTGWFKGNGPN